MSIYHDILHENFGYTEFRGIQEEIIESIGSGNDTLGLMPTGGGESLTFQVPALAKEGVCIVVTPLIALMKDQVQHLRQRGIQAAAIYSGMTHDDILKTLDNAVLGGVKLLYVSPERLSSTIFLKKVSHMNVSFIVVDEAHCISQWGYDFRPSYLEIAKIRDILPDKPILALTATATPEVVDDIQKQLGFSKPCVYRMSFKRDNLAYVVRKSSDKLTTLVHVLNAVRGSAIVYVRSRRRSKEISDYLNKQEIISTFYHAGLHNAIKDQRQDEWQNDEIRVMVATNAFGMGIDKPDVRLVVHYDMPDSLEAYFQEAGRAGRDGKKSYALLLSDSSDSITLKRRLASNFPPKTYIQDVYEHLAYYYEVGIDSGAGTTYLFDIDKFCHAYKYFPTSVHSALQIIERAGYIDYNLSPDQRSKVMFLLTRSQLNLLNRTAPHEDLVIKALLRNYGGLFVDKVNIDEHFIAAQANLTVDNVYQVLKSLSHQRIISYRPHRNEPLITYTRPRTDGCKLIIPEDVYEKRRQQFSNRIEHVLKYANDDEHCRSRQLLEYFGETDSADCMICDVCNEKYHPERRENGIKNAMNTILQLLNDGKRHNITDINSICLPQNYIDEALHLLINEEEISIEDSFIFISRHK